ncbi:hypothetical protein ETB97_010948 [Aspergillus alliaceus]|uniref:Uncharacterized protein n=1 Tax=Petromyces alliaceus TaxID=209559 RepID=A0A8H6E810_PETAA|nr:hypothetical protein ETB97_010948 [Aspergillus burnettii]
MNATAPHLIAQEASTPQDTGNATSRMGYCDRNDPNAQRDGEKRGAYRGAGSVAGPTDIDKPAPAPAAWFVLQSLELCIDMNSKGCIEARYTSNGGRRLSANIRYFLVVENLPTNRQATTVRPAQWFLFSETNLRVTRSKQLKHLEPKREFNNVTSPNPSADEHWHLVIWS